MLEEAFQLLVRLDHMGANYRYHHNLQEVFFDKQLYAFLAKKLKTEQALIDFFSFCWQYIVKRSKENVTAQNLVGNFTETPLLPSKINKDSPEGAFLPPNFEQLQENAPKSNTVNKFDFFPHILNKARIVLSKESYRGFLCKCYTDSIFRNDDNFKEEVICETEQFINSVTRNDGGVVHSFLKNPLLFIDLLTIARHISPEAYKTHCETLLRDLYESEQCMDIARNTFLFIDHPYISLNILLNAYWTGENLTRRDLALSHYSICYQREVHSKLFYWRPTKPDDLEPTIEVFRQGLVEDTSLFKLNLISGQESFGDIFVKNVSDPLGYTADYIAAFEELVTQRKELFDEQLENLINEECIMANDLHRVMNVDVKNYPVIKAYDLCGDVFFPELGVVSGYKDKDS